MQVYICNEHVRLSVPNYEWNDFTEELQEQLISTASRHEVYAFNHTLYFRPTAWSGIRPLIPSRRPLRKLPKRKV